MKITRFINVVHFTINGLKLGTYSLSGPGSPVGIATGLLAGRSGIESRWGRDFPAVQTGPGAHPASCTMGTGSFPGVKCGRGVLLTTHQLLVLRLWKSTAIPLPTLWATPGLWRNHFTFTYSLKLALSQRSMTECSDRDVIYCKFIQLLH